MNQDQKDDIAKSQEAVPPGLEFLAGKNPVEAVQAMFPNACVNISALAPFLAISGYDCGISSPEWAKESLRNAFKILGFGNAQEIENFASVAAGKAVGFVENAPPPKSEILKSESANQFKNTFCQMAKAEAANASPEVSKQFFNARAQGANAIQRMKFAPQRGKVYLLIAIAWETVACFKSAAELHRWLIKQKAILPQTDPAETRKICKIIGLPLHGKPGRPSKK